MATKHLDPEQLEVFLAVAEELSFSRAGRRVNLSQSAVSRVIAQLERQLGVALFNRSTRTVSLTTHGEQFVEVARTITSQSQRALDDFQAFVHAEGGVITFAALQSIAATMLPRVLASFRATHPGIEIRVLDVTADEIQRLVTGGQIDFGLSFIGMEGDPPSPPGMSHLERTPLFLDTLLLAVHPDHPLAAQESVSWAEMAEHPVITMTPASSTGRIERDIPAQQGLTLQINTTATTIQTVVALVSAGLGVAPVPALAVPMISYTDLAFRPMREPRVRRQIGILRNRAYPLSPPAAAFIDHLRSMRDSDLKLWQGVTRL